ncbi:hypothetical protein LZ31DRAFT_260258 [Colletotrichum somersetense]|nr:hypothetical protein LZ31DRAFT_260258 [Colletotrichum somersetense]
MRLTVGRQTGRNSHDRQPPPSLDPSYRCSCVHHSNGAISLCDVDLAAVWILNNPMVIWKRRETAVAFCHFLSLVQHHARLPHHHWRHSWLPPMSRRGAFQDFVLYTSRPPSKKPKVQLRDGKQAGVFYHERTDTLPRNDTLKYVPVCCSSNPCSLFRLDR